MMSETKVKELANTLMNQVTLSAPINSEFFIDQLLSETLLQLNKADKRTLTELVQSKLLEHNYIICNDFTGAVALTTQGRNIKNNGGHEKYNQSEIKKNKKKENLEIDNLKYSVRVNKWLYKTRWLPLILSVLAVIISIIALFYD